VRGGRNCRRERSFSICRDLRSRTGRSHGLGLRWSHNTCLRYYLAVRTSENSVNAKFGTAPAPIGPGPPARDAHTAGYYECCVRIHQGAGRGLRASGRGKAKGQSPVRESSDPMRETGEPSTGNVIVCCVALCPPHRGSHGRTTDTLAQRTGGAKRRPRWWRSSQ
jgi:hypothetical protein